MITLATAIFMAGSLTVLGQSQDPVNKKKETTKMTANNSSTSHMANSQAMPMQSGHHRMTNDQQQANMHSKAMMNNQQQGNMHANTMKNQTPANKKKESTKNAKMKSSDKKTGTSTAKNDKKMKPKDYNEPAKK